MTVFFIILLVVLFYIFIFYGNHRKLYVNRATGVGYELIKTYCINNIQYYTLRNTEDGNIIDITSAEFIKSFKLN